MAYLALAVAGCLWGTGFLCGKIAFRELSVSHMLVYRFVFASIGLLPFALLSRHTAAKRSDPIRVAIWFLAASVIGVPIQFLVQFAGLARTTVSHASLMIGTLPMLLALGAAVFMGERIDRRGWMAILGSTFGVALIVIGKPADAAAAATSGPTLTGDLVVLISLFATVAWMLMSKRLMEEFPPLMVSIGVTWFGTLMLLVWVVITQGPPPLRLSLQTWTAVIAAGLLATTATTVLWNWGLSRVPASRAGVFANLEPVVGTILGVTVLQEALGSLAIAGGVLIIGAAALITAPDSRA